MTNSRRDGLYLLILGSLVLILLGTVLSTTSSVDMIDYRAVYFPARCMIEHCDPYSEDAVLRLADAEGGVRTSDTAHINNHFARFQYLPTTLSIIVPFAWLPWEVSHVLWMLLTTSGLILASFLIWDIGSGYSAVLSGALAGFFLANCELLLVIGNLAGLGVALCIVAVWCLLRDRFLVVGIACLAISLALKPHDSGLVWLYFLLAGGAYRKRALQTLLVVGALGLPGVAWCSYLAPHWIQECQSNILANAAGGGINDISFASTGGHGLGMIVSLQTVFRAFWNNPYAYNTATYVVCGPLIVIWIFMVMRSRPSPAEAWLAVAAIAALTMLPVYHRQYDAKLLLLTVPGCAVLWSEGGIVGWLALLLNTAGFVVTGDLSWLGILGLVGNLFSPATELGNRIVTALQVFSAPLVILAIGIFYLFVYAQRSSAWQLMDRGNKELVDLSERVLRSPS